jgi:hypothetical protein
MRKQIAKSKSKVSKFAPVSGSQTSTHYRDGSKKIILAEPLSSNGVDRYKIILGRDNVVYCTCVGWGFRKSCSHLYKFNANRQYVPLAA